MAPIIYRCVLMTFSGVFYPCNVANLLHIWLFLVSASFFFSHPKNRVVGPALATRVKLPLCGHPWNKALLSSETEAANL